MEKAATSYDCAVDEANGDMGKDIIVKNYIRKEENCIV